VLYVLSVLVNIPLVHAAPHSYPTRRSSDLFYGPKIDIKWVGALGREWTGPTIQVDFNLPERFDVNYIGEDGERHRAVMIHRTLRSEEHTSELQSRENLVCRLLLENKNKNST